VLLLNKFFTQVATTAIFYLFSRFGASAKTKILVLGSIEAGLLENQVRSLNIEHVSLTHMFSREISRQPHSKHEAHEAIALAVMRRWYFARKPDAGFLLTEFPATLLQAKVMDEWLEVRDETLDGIIVLPDAPQSLINYYHMQGMLDPHLV
jgi:adenylate kinase